MIMKKHYLILCFIINILFIPFTFSQNVLITTIVDGTLANNACTGGSGSDPRFVELYISGTINFNGYDLDLETNGLYDAAGLKWVSKDISDLDTITNSFVYLVHSADLTAFDAAFPGKTRIPISMSSINGNDSFRIEDNNGNILDVFGNPSEIISSSTFTNWNYQDSYAKRKNGQTPNNGTFNENDFIYGGANLLDSKNCTEIAIAVNLGSYIAWTGTTDNNWLTTSNWSTGSIPSTSDDIVIPNGLANYPTIGTATIINHVTIQSGASLVANATVTGDVTYKRTLTDKWHLVSSPVSGETIENLRTVNTFIAGSGGDRIGLAPYDNNDTAWNYQTNSSTGPITPGQGFSTKFAAAGDISFTGSINTSSVNYPITQGTTSDFNLVGNPYTSYMNLGTFFTNNNGGALSEQTVWMWNQATTSYDLKMYGTDASFQVAPAQGFFVSAGSNTNLVFNQTNQSYQTDTFQRSSKSEINITINENGQLKSTKIYFIDGVTKGFDNGYDGTVFGAVTTNFNIYSQLVNDNLGKNYAIQSLPLNDIDNMVIPLGIKLDAGKEIKFSSASINLPDGIKIYLEDRINEKFIDITENEYKTNFNKEANGIGQFYLHTSEYKLDTPIASLIEDISLYKSDSNTLSIVGLQIENASLKLYSLTGKKVSDQKFSSKGYSTINIPSLANGIYIIELTSELGKINKKIIL
jgi:hypothetical protein